MRLRRELIHTPDGAIGAPETTEEKLGAFVVLMVCFLGAAAIAAGVAAKLSGAHSLPIPDLPPVMLCGAGGALTGLLLAWGLRRTGRKPLYLAQIAASAALWAGLAAMRGQDLTLIPAAGLWLNVLLVMPFLVRRRPAITHWAIACALLGGLMLTIGFPIFAQCCHPVNCDVVAGETTFIASVPMGVFLGPALISNNAERNFPFEASSDGELPYGHQVRP